MKSRSFWIELAENVVVSYAYAAVTYLLLNGVGEINLTVLQGAAYAGVPAALAVLKGFLASLKGDHDSPAFTR